MLDFNSTQTFYERINAHIDKALEELHHKQPKRGYIGASRLGVACNRYLQYEFLYTPKDEGRNFQGKTLRIFAAGHVFEDLAVKWLRQAGFELYTETSSGGQFGFSAAGGKIKGHVDGIINDAPKELGLSFPALWECKSLNNKSWKDTVKKGLAVSKPIYAAQVALYQAYMETTISGISSNPALFTAVNKDTAEIYHELVPFDMALAQKASDKGVQVIKACEAHELLPRISSTPTYIDCKFCDYQDRCWSKKNNILKIEGNG